MEAAIERGRVLREILKQERLVPLSIEFQLAWLVAFNDGLFDGVDPANVSQLLERLEGHVKETRLNVDSEREAWAQEVASWFHLARRENHDATP